MPALRTVENHNNTCDIYVYYIRYEIKEGEAVSGLHDGCENDTMNLVKEMRAEAQTAS